MAPPPDDSEKTRRALELELRNTLPGSPEERAIREKLRQLEATASAAPDAPTDARQPPEDTATPPGRAASGFKGFFESPARWKTRPPKWLVSLVCIAATCGALLYGLTARTPDPHDKGERWADPVTGMAFVWIPGGCFRMGCDGAGCAAYETPIHEVCVNGFWMGIHEVTQGQWTSVLGKNPSAFDLGDDHPVEMVSWTDAHEFIRMLNQHPKTSGGRFRLPTEAEWEYACRGDGDSEPSPADTAWSRADAGDRSRPAGQKSANGFGLFDMLGNVHEWCEDTYAADAYAAHSRQNPCYAGEGAGRVARGGGWTTAPADLRCAARFGAPTDARSNDIGFRLARTDAPPSE